MASGMSLQDPKPAIPPVSPKDTPSRSSPLSQPKDPIRLEYELWDRSYKSMKESPPSRGREYLKHAKNLLNLLEGIAEIHPIAKATVASFKAILLFEEDRRENDARVTAVFLAQTDMMRVLLDIDYLANRRPVRMDVEHLRTSMSIGNILDQIQKEIKTCGNSIDTYYKEHRLLKFWKSADWKQRVLGHIEEFNRFRLLLQQALSIQVASGVDDLVFKMDMVLASLFSPKADWEKELASQSRRLGKMEAWINDDETLLSLVSTSKDPSWNMNAEKSNFEFLTALQHLKKDLGMSLDQLCERNLDMFELKLKLHTQQIQEAILNSARFVVRTLSGPHNRLYNEDLRELWKEMNWIFCVDNKLFASALFEYYLDKFSAQPKREQTTEAKVEDEKPGNEALGQVESPTPSVPHSRFSLRLSSLNHPDAWTLECIALNGHQITTAIDTDNSGFIRISEANQFTEQIPKEWNLPQWCAYVAAGWAYEARIYRKRINCALAKITELQVSVLSSNKAYLLIWIHTFLWACLQDLSREPPEQNHPSVPLELRTSVKNKIHSQDAKLRESLSALNWTLEDPSSIRLVYGDRPVETYILQVAFLMSEYLLQITQACCTVTLDLREWVRLLTNFRTIRDLSIQRVDFLKDMFDSDHASTRTIKSYHGGIWSCLDARISARAFSKYFSPYPYTLEEALDYLSDIDVLDEFPLPSLPTGTLPYLRYTPWEEFTKTMNNSEIPASIPSTWSPFDEGYPKKLSDRQKLLIEAGWFCNVCGTAHPLEDRKHHCAECTDFDLCIECLNLPPDKPNVDIQECDNHSYEHLLMCQSLQFSGEHADRIAWEAKVALEELREALSATRRSSTLPATGDPICGSCSGIISDDTRFYTCLVRSCRGLRLCMKCVQDKKDATGEHQLWHTLLVVRKGLIDFEPETKPLTAPAAEESPDVELKAEIAEDPRHATIISSIADINVRMNTMGGTLESNHSALEERISKIESKMDEMVTELKKLLVALETKDLSTI